MIAILGVVVLGYLSGSLPWGLWLGHWLRGVDVRTLGSGNLGATNVYRQLGPPIGLTVLALDIAKGALPTSKPSRPTGVERNVVVTMWDWMTPSTYGHDLISTDKRNPRVNANGLVYGAPEESTDRIPVLDPVANTASFITAPGMSSTPSISSMSRL